MKQCNKCDTLKPLTGFNKNPRTKDGLQTYCSECAKAYSKSHFQRNRAAYSARATKYKIVLDKKIREWLRDYKSQLCCVECGEDHPATLDFHHNDPSIKDLPVSSLVQRGSIKRLQEEINKCTVLCANCHRKFHASVTPYASNVEKGNG